MQREFEQRVLGVRVNSNGDDIDFNRMSGGRLVGSLGFGVEKMLHWFQYKVAQRTVL